MSSSPTAPEHERTGPGSLSGLPRVLGKVGRANGGATLLCVGGLHGNEPVGVLALRNVLARLEQDAGGVRGCFVALTGNRKALARDQRFLQEDLNRIWHAERLERVHAEPHALGHEDEELHQLSQALDEVLAAATGSVAFLDLHSTSGKRGVFTTLDDTLANRELAFALPVTHVLGLEEELGGTLLGHLNERGVTGIGFEAGQHENPVSVDRAEAALWITLESTGVLERGSRPEVTAARAFLDRECADRPGVVEVRYRHSVGPDDGFRMQPGFSNFQPIRAGEPLARSHAGEVRAPIHGVMLMPLYQGQGEDGFFIVRRVHPFWLALSAWMRRTRCGRLAHWLPGVARDPDDRDVLVVDTSRALWLALPIFHLLGYKRRPSSGTLLRFVRRDEPGAGRHAR